MAVHRVPLDPSHVRLEQRARFADAKVHRGFYHAYRSVRDQVLMSLQHMMFADELVIERILVSGHSFGGAMAHFLYLDVQTRYPSCPLEMYTFGAPRTGTKTFATAFNAAMPRCFRLVFERDPIPFVPKGLGYCHAGHECLLDRHGNLIVHPTSVERKLLRQTFRRLDHKRFSYAVGLHALVDRTRAMQTLVSEAAVVDMDTLLNTIDVALSNQYRQTQHSFRGLDGFITKHTWKLCGPWPCS